MAKSSYDSLPLQIHHEIEGGGGTLHRSNEWNYSSSLKFKVKCVGTILTHNNSSVVETGLYEVLCKKFCLSLLHDHSGRMVIPGPFQRQFKNNYLIFKLNYFIITSFSY